MLLVAEIALLLIAVYSLITGRLPINSGGKFVVLGWPARVIGGIGLLPIPLTLQVNSILAEILVVQGRTITPDSIEWMTTFVELSVVVLCVLAMFVLTLTYRIPVESVQLPDRYRYFDAPLPVIRDAIEEALRERGARSVKWSSDQCRASALLRGTLFNSASRMTFKVGDTGEVRVSSESRSWQLVDWG